MAHRARPSVLHAAAPLSLSFPLRLTCWQMQNMFKYIFSPSLSLRKEMLPSKLLHRWFIYCCLFLLELANYSWAWRTEPFCRLWQSHSQFREVIKACFWWPRNLTEDLLHKENEKINCTMAAVAVWRILAVNAPHTLATSFLLSTVGQSNGGKLSGR